MSIVVILDNSTWLILIIINLVVVAFGGAGMFQVIDHLRR